MSILRTVSSWFGGRQSREIKALRQQVRQQGFAIHASHDAAKTTNSNTRYWANADALSATAANSAAVRLVLRKRARYEYANNSSLTGIVSTLANDVIGTNITLRLTGMPEDVARVVEAEFARWCKRVNLSKKLRLLRSEKVIDGEAFAILKRNPKLNHPVKLDIQTIEADRIADPHSIENERWEDGGWNVDGVLLDRYGNAVGYQVLLEHPGALMSTSSIFEFETYSAARMIHWFSPTRSGQYRGVPEVSSSLGAFGLRREYQRAVVDAARNAAQFSMVYSTQESPVDGAVSIPDGMVQEIEHNMIQFAPEGYTPFQLKPEQPIAAYEGFDGRQLTESSRCLNVPANIASGDSSKYNFASGRLDHQVYWRSQDVERSELETDVLEKVLDLWVFEASRIDGYLPEEATEELADWSHEWGYDGRQHVDPNLEAKAQAVRLSNRTTTMAQEVGAVGLDWQEVMDQQAKENEYAASRGLALPFQPDEAESEPIAEPIAKPVAEPEPVAEEVAEPTAEGEAPETDESAQELETSPALTLNGGQIESAAKIVSQVSEGILSRDTGLGMLEVLLNLSEDQALRVLGDAGIDIEESNGTQQTATQEGEADRPAPPVTATATDQGKRGAGIAASR